MSTVVRVCAGMCLPLLITPVVRFEMFSTTLFLGCLVAFVSVLGESWSAASLNLISQAPTSKLP